mgnify:FL=1
MILQVILEGLGLGILLVLVCAVGIRKGGGWDGASLQPGGAAAVRNAGTYNT